MTEPERKIARALLDQAKRAVLTPLPGGSGICEWCDGPYVVTGGHKPRRFCRDACRKAAWRSTPEGCASSIAANLRYDLKTGRRRRTAVLA